MWGSEAVGRLEKGDEPLKPRVIAFVDDEAGPEVMQKVSRRLQHFIDRKIDAQFEPLFAMQKDEALAGLAKGFAFRLVEAMGVIPRSDVANEVKDLDQASRGALRKHGVRFGQFTIFLPALLKPAPTRLRLLLWSLAQGFDEYPESPPPGLVTIPVVPDVPNGTYTMGGYRAAGERAIRIDMLERLADLLRAKDSRAGFEATPDMLSISGTTLEQFAKLMDGLGYNAEKGERPKVAGPKETPATDAPKVEDAAVEPAAIEASAEAETPSAEVAETPDAGATPLSGAPDAETPAPTTGADDGVAAVTDADAEGTPEGAETAEPAEMEVFYTFTWGGRGRQNERPRGAKPQGQKADGARPRGKGKGRGKLEGGKGKQGNRAPQNAQSRPPKKDKPIDPSNPFAEALMGLKKD